MEIIIKHEERKIELKDLECGEVFEYNNQFCIKICKFNEMNVLGYIKEVINDSNLTNRTLCYVFATKIENEIKKRSSLFVINDDAEIIPKSSKIEIGRFCK